MSELKYQGARVLSKNVSSVFQKTKFIGKRQVQIDKYCVSASQIVQGSCKNGLFFFYNFTVYIYLSLCYHISVGLIIFEVTRYLYNPNLNLRDPFSGGLYLIWTQDDFTISSVPT